MQKNAVGNPDFADIVERCVAPDEREIQKDQVRLEHLAEIEHLSVFKLTYPAGPRIRSTRRIFAS